MTRVNAYQASDGSLHPDKASAAFASIMHLGKTASRDQRGQCIGADEVAFLIKYREKIAAILHEIDAPEAIPECGCGH